MTILAPAQVAPGHDKRLSAVWPQQVLGAPGLLPSPSPWPPLGPALIGS